MSAAGTPGRTILVVDDDATKPTDAEELIAALTREAPA
jgi:hypothetical protein